MCLAIPGKVVEIKDDKVIVDYEKEKREATNLLDIKIGDYVLVSQKFVIRKIPENEALEAIKLYDEGLK